MNPAQKPSGDDSKHNQNRLLSSENQNGWPLGCVCVWWSQQKDEKPMVI